MKAAEPEATDLGISSDLQWKPREKVTPRRKIDADGDGVEDNRKVARHWLDKMQSEVYGSHLDDLHNTSNGEYPGHDRWGEFPAPGKQAGEDEYYSEVP